MQNQLLRFLKAAFPGIFVITAIIGLINCAAPTLSQQNNASTTNMNQANQSNAAANQEQPLFACNGMPGEMHRRLDALVGNWDVQKTSFMAGGTAENPRISETITARREWIKETGNRFLKDETQGTMGGSPYYRLGILGFSIVDNRYEWNTTDALNANMMTYKGAKNSGSATGDIVVSGEFTEQGLLGDSYAGKNISQRTVMKIESPDRHTFELYFTPPGEPERLVDRMVFTRRK